MNVKQIVIAHLRHIGADGLCAEECGCGLDDMMPCGYAGFGDCKPAKAVQCDGTCTNCEFTEEGNHDEICYRQMEILTEEEETHL